MIHGSLKEQFWYIPSGDYELAAFVGIPGNFVNAPIIIMCHGFTGTKTEKCRLFYRLAHTLVTAGFISIRFDFSGFGDSTAHSTSFSISQGVSDIRSVLEFVQKYYRCAASQTGIIGYSLGGLIAANAISSGLSISAACLIAAVEHYTLSREEREGLGSHAEPVFWNSGFELSMNFLDELLNSKGSQFIAGTRIPLQLIYGTADEVVPLDHLEEYKKTLLNEAFPPVVIEGAGHHFAEKSFQEQLDSTVLSFFTSTLKTDSL